MPLVRRSGSAAGWCGVSCAFTIPDEGPPEIVVVVDPDGECFECRNGNNRGVVPVVHWGPI